MTRLITLQQASKKLGVTSKTLRRWDNSGKLPALRSPTGYRMYKESDINRLAGIVEEIKRDNLPVAVYCRVSSGDQKQKGDLERQKGRVLDYCVKQGYQVLKVFEEVSSGMNDNRAKIHALFKLVTQHKINRVVVEYKDRLTRFNFRFLEEFFKSHGVTIECVSSQMDKSFEEELTQDIISLLASMSAKLYGRRSAENRRKKEAEQSKNNPISSILLLMPILQETFVSIAHKAGHLA
ncbi:MAG: IS607 family transposase [Nostocaceae cyanobacterium]|nr:IS607 family transposase [Nostocaceae cyanobacterium]